MPLIALDDVPHLILSHPRHHFLAREAVDVLPQSVHRVVRALGVKHLWQLLTFSGRELEEAIGMDVADAHAMKLIRDTLRPFGVNPRENEPYALRVPDKSCCIKLLTEHTSMLVSSYEEATMFWTRWSAMRARANLKAAFPTAQVVLRSESLKLGPPLVKTGSA